MKRQQLKHGLGRRTSKILAGHRGHDLERSTTPREQRERMSEPFAELSILSKLAPILALVSRRPKHCSPSHHLGKHAVPQMRSRGCRGYAAVSACSLVMPMMTNMMYSSRDGKGRIQVPVSSLPLHRTISILPISESFYCYSDPH